MSGLIYDVQYALVATNTAIVPFGGARLHGVLVTVATATNIITIRNGLTATGDIVVSIPASSAVNTFVDMKGIRMNTGIFADFTGTGTIVVMYSTG